MPYGTELLLGDGDFYNGVSFDGIRYMRMGERYNVNAFYYKLFEANNFFGAGSNDENLFGFDFDWKLNKLGTVGAYWFTAQILDIDSKLDTYGARWNKMPSADSAFDWNLEYALQSGDFGDPFGGPRRSTSRPTFSRRGSASASAAASVNRISVGYLNASGDDDPLDNDLDSFPTVVRRHPRGWPPWQPRHLLPSDIEDINAMWSGTFSDGRHMLGAGFHNFTVADPFPGANDDLGTEIDLTYDYMPNKVLSFQVGYGQLSGADALVSGATVAALGGGPPITEADTITRFWAQVRARW
jgi:hypothetical protein